jgi:pimeloyl-ACP methyl ester carboxylesterase
VYRWRREGLTFVHRGHSIFYRTAGQGPALLVIHGFPSASWDFHPMWSALVARFRVVAPDLIGFGWSDKPRAYDYSILDQASLCEGLLEELGIERVHVLAHDYGDTVAQELLARHEERRGRSERGVAIESVCFLNGGLFPETHRALPVQKVLASRLGWVVSAVMTKAAFGSGMRRIFGRGTPPSAELIDELWTLLRHRNGHRVLHRLIGYMAERRRCRERWVGVLTHTKVPLRVIDGVADPVSGAHMVARYREIVSNADVVELDAIGHYPHVEAPERVLQAFLAFHERLPRS